VQERLEVEPRFGLPRTKRDGNVWQRIAEVDRPEPHPRTFLPAAHRDEVIATYSSIFTT
jgi:hypothetical protein